MKKEEKKEDWMQKKWRPMMAIMYMMVCIFDFIVFPIMFTIVQFWETQAANDAFRQWQPLTLVGAGLFHMAMGAVLGITAWSRGQEKIAGVASAPPAPAAPSFPPASNQIMSNTPSTITPVSTITISQPYDEPAAPVTMGYKGKKAPQEPEHPLI